MNYQKLMNLNPTKYGEIINKKNQLIEFYEHPIYGGDSEVVAVCHALQIAANTDFYELDDMTAPHEDYRPFFIDGALRYGYEFM
jgi:hypothetical protein